MRFFVCAALIWNFVPAVAQTVDFYLDCDSQKEKCQKFTLPSPVSTYAVEPEWQIKPAMTIDESGMAQAYLAYNEYDELVMQMRFSDEKSKELERITAANQGRNLAIIVDGQVLISALIREKIPGEVVLSFGKDGFNPFWEKIPWLAKMVGPTPKKPKPWTGSGPLDVFRENMLYRIGVILLAVWLFSGISYLLLSKRRKSR